MTTHSLVRRVPIALLVFFLAAATAWADWADQFTGGYQQTWFSGNLTGVPGTPSGTFQFGVVNDTLDMSDATSVFLGGAASGFGLVPEVFQDVHMSAILNPAAASTMNWDVGLVARVDSTNLSGYALTVDFYKGQLDLTRIDAGGASDWLGGVPIDGFTFEQHNDRSVYLEFDLVGSTISGRVYDTPGGTLLTDPFSVADATYAAGLSGVLAALKTDGSYAEISTGLPLHGSFDNVTASAIPEPSTLALLAAGALALACWIWGRRI